MELAGLVQSLHEARLPGHEALEAEGPRSLAVAGVHPGLDIGENFCQAQGKGQRQTSKVDPEVD